MSHEPDIDKAIAAHDAWKRRLLSAVSSGSSEFSPDLVRLESRCDFGKWFFGLPAEIRDTEQARKIRQLHAAFHAEAARILSLALEGRRDEAMRSLSSESQYASLSRQLALVLGDWKQQIRADG